MGRMQASSFDEALFNEIQETIEAQIGEIHTPDLESHILGETSKTDEEANLLNAQFCHEFMSMPLYPLYAQSLFKMVERERKIFEDADSDPGDRLRANWKIAQKIVTEILGNVQSGAEYYISSQKPIEDGLLQAGVQ